MSAKVNPFDSGYQSPCKDCPFVDEDKKDRTGGSGFKLRKECETCKWRNKLIEVMDKDPIQVADDSELSINLFTRTHHSAES